MYNDQSLCFTPFLKAYKSSKRCNNDDFAYAVHSEIGHSAVEGKNQS